MRVEVVTLSRRSTILNCHACAAGTEVLGSA